MSLFTKRGAWQAVLALLIIVALALPLGDLQAQSGNRGRSNFDWIIARRILITPLGLTVTGDTLLADATAEDVTATTLTSTVITVTSDLVLDAQSVITVTNGATLSPTGSYQPLAAAGAVGFGAITIAPAGSVLTLVNTVNQTITITDTGTLKLSGNAALGQYDSIQLLSDGTNWIQIAPESDN